MNASQGNPEVYRILVIDDTPSIHEDFLKILTPPPDKGEEISNFASAIFGAASRAPRRSHFEIDSAMQGEAGLALLLDAEAAGRPYALAFVDMRMPPGWNGVETIRRLWAADPTLQVVICTAYSDTSWDETFRVLGESDSLLVLKKPFDSIEALQLARALTRKWVVARQNRDRLATLDQTVKQRTTELLAAEERFSQSFNASPLPQAIHNLTTGGLVEVNAAFEKLSGQTRREILATKNSDSPFAELLNGHALLNTLLAGLPVDEYAFVLKSDRGATLDLRCSGRAVRIGELTCAIWVFRNVTEQLLLEQQSRQGQKMEAVGQLAAGIAHDFNNLLTVILSYSSFVLDDTSLPDEHRSGLGQVCAAAQRAAALTRQLLLFSRRQITTSEPLDVGSTLGNVRQMLSRLLPERIKLDWDCSENLPQVHADAAHLEQIVLNLIVNARDAITNCGTIKLHLQAMTLGDGEIRRHPNARAGQFVCLSVADNGKGMEPTVLARIFEPFFTTKNIGEGTGLGLSTVYGVVQQHEGWVEVTSAPGCGTTFRVFLPALVQRVANSAAEESKVVARDLAPSHGESILLVEDEPFLRETTALVAMRAGYRVTQASDGPGALKAWSENARPFDLLLTDVMMPNGLTGIQLAAQLRTSHPALKVIFSTGYSEELLRSGATAVPGAHLLLKPYTSAELLIAVDQALHSTAARATISPFGSHLSAFSASS